MLVLDAFDQVAPLAQLKGIELRHRLDEVDESLVWADASLLTRALFNLLENAIKYSPSGTCVSLDVKVGDNQLSCSIRDQGQGIGVEELPQLFDPYKRFTSSVSTEGQGTTFTLCLPLWQD